MIIGLAATAILVTSPDGSVRLEIASNGSTLSLARKGEQILATSQLGLSLASSPAFGKLKLVSARRATMRRTIPLTATKARTALDHYNSAVISFRETAGSRRILMIEARAYNDGIAFRYRLPEGAPVSVKTEETTFRFAGDPTCLVTEYSGSHENSWAFRKISELDSAKAYDLLASCESPSGRTHFAITQADLSDYAGASLRPANDGLQVKLTPRVDNRDVAVVSASGLHSAWRVVMLGNRAGNLIESNLIGNIAPQAAGDFSWVKPGLTAWDWWSGPTNGEKPSMQRYERFIDFAAASGFPYFLIDAGWAYKSGPCCDASPETDITRPEPAIDMPALVKYAADRRVGLVLWVHWKHLAQRMADALDTYQRWGIKGVKVDFTQRDDQQMVEFFLRAARETARRHLMLDQHGCFPPAGIARTYPNYLTQEGVQGLEYDKFPWGQVTPDHNVKIAYTRMLVGPMDYTPGGFRNSTPQTYVQSEVMPMTRTTRGQAIAQYVVYESPLQMVSDDPSAYTNAAGFDFIKAVPTAWDETKFVGGTPDSFVAVARRKGPRWYLGLITNEEGRTVNIPLSFLRRGQFKATIWQDGVGPNDVERTHRSVTSRDSLTVKTASGGGSAAIFEPAK